MDAEERHGFEGDGFSYLKSPLWWAGIISCTQSVNLDKPILTNKHRSNYWRNSKLCCICFCAGHSSNTTRSIECLNWRCIGLILPEGGTRDVGKTWMRDMSYWLSHYRPTCAAGPRNRES